MFEIGNVLGLFDGIGCGCQALKDAGVSFGRYFASEIDKQAAATSSRNHHEIEHVGDVRGVTTDRLPKIDLLIGGSPCQGFSAAGKGLAFDDPRSALFFEYLRLLSELQPRYFLLENVPMKSEHVDTISGFMGCRPVEINSARFVPQNRRRLYWTNIPVGIVPDERAGGTLARVLLPREMCKDITESVMRKTTGTRSHRYAHCSKRTPNQIAKCLTANGRDSTAASATTIFIQRSDKNIQRGTKNPEQIANCITAAGRQVCGTASATHPYVGGRWYRLHPIECERLQGLPDNYTAGLSDSARYRLLGNGWTVPVIAHIFKGLQSIWDLEDL